MGNNSLNYGGDRDDLTICAVATPFGYGGISVIRVSGPNSLVVCRKIAKFLPQKIESHKAYFGTLTDSNGEIDEVLVTYFAHGNSFTGEEVLEISCHGNPLLCDLITNSLIDNGAVSAGPGEFTYRAFINGKMDLAQAESVLTLIQSRSKKSSQISLRHFIADGMGKEIEYLCLLSAFFHF